MAIDPDVIDMFQPLIDDLKARITDLESASAVPVDLSKIEGAISDLVARVQDLEDVPPGSPVDLSEIENRLDNLENVASALSVAVNIPINPVKVVATYADGEMLTYTTVSAG